MPRGGGGQGGPLVGADAPTIGVTTVPGSPARRGGRSKLGVAPVMGSPSGRGGRHKLTKAQLDALGVTDVMRHIEVIPEAARAKLEDEAAGLASVLLERHKRGRGHLQREKKAGIGGGRERGRSHGKGGGQGR